MTTDYGGPAIPVPLVYACPLHADVRVMSGNCWMATVRWTGTHHHLGELNRRLAYQAAVERQMLDELARSVQPVCVTPIITS
ncbi:hypothetical protein [Streptomyces sp. NBC_01431]|uniref:hypothetical protein n=1 Tax=Streptomyces sp. NBC_01431 TaxID=2903863 RepID=UPI002E33800E|nr:hypothetical protein [Streptomyces sp. NBC_01431]